MKLPENGDEPLVLADGTKIHPATGEVIKERRSAFVEVPAPSAAQAMVVRARKSVADLPAPPAQLTGVALVAFYTLFGLSDEDISLAVDGRLTVQQIENVRKLDAYIEFMDHARTNIVESAGDEVRGIFKQHAANAARNIVEMAANGDDVLSFKASQDILDRAGHRPADVVEHRMRMEDALNIVVIHKTDAQDLPVIDLEPEKVTLDESL